MAISLSAPPATFSISRACDGQSSGCVICSQVSPTVSSIERPMMSAMRWFTRVSRPSSDSSEMPSDAWPNIASSRAACRRASRSDVSRARANAAMSRAMPVKTAACVTCEQAPALAGCVSAR